MGSQKPIIGGYKADLVAVILDRHCAQQLAIALAWALGTTGGGKTKGKGGYPSGRPQKPPGKLKAVGAPKLVGALKPTAAAAAAPAKKSGAKKTAAKKAGAKKSGGSK